MCWVSVHFESVHIPCDKVIRERERESSIPQQDLECLLLCHNPCNRLFWVLNVKYDSIE